MPEYGCQDKHTAYPEHTVKVGGTQRIPRMPPDFKTQEMAALAQAKDTAANRKTNALADMN